MSKYAKAIAAGLYVAGVKVLTFLTGDETLADVTTKEWVTVGVEVLGAYGVVYAVPNWERLKDKSPTVKTVVTAAFVAAITALVVLL